MKNIIYGLTALLLTAGCTKTEKLPEGPSNQLLDFRISTSDGDLRAVIDDQRKTINIQLPYYLYQLKTVPATIRVSTGATVQPASGELADLRDSTVTYTVKSAGGATAVYKLRVHVMQIPHSITELSTLQDTFSLRLGEAVKVMGKNIIADSTLAYISLISLKTGKETRLHRAVPIISTTSLDGTVMNDKTLDTGLYKVKVTSLKEAVVAQYPIRLKFALPVLTLNEYKVTAKQGGTFTIAGKDIRGLKYFSIRTAQTGGVFDPVGYKQLEIVSQTEDKAILRIPDNFPVGAFPSSPTASLWCDIDFEEKGREFYGYGGFQITVTAK